MVAIRENPGQSQNTWPISSSPVLHLGQIGRQTLTQFDYCFCLFFLPPPVLVSIDLPILEFQSPPHSPAQSAMEQTLGRPNTPPVPGTIPSSSFPPCWAILNNVLDQLNI
ncbi:hypothetical protein EPI10_032723 [Gossypium australe]|uniref:Uncharacterized protein n=1 Tax=Gossypium australe TaxID=47621 RepID=A0A5B6X7S3_9ROSI|nr:hypothetical protein EPI10_032723 [Gossypium australe]